MRRSTRSFGVSNGDVIMVDSNEKSGAISSTKSQASEPERNRRPLAGTPSAKRADPAGNPVADQQTVPPLVNRKPFLQDREVLIVYY